jgi:hypothetical protein
VADESMDDESSCRRQGDRELAVVAPSRTSEVVAPPASALAPFASTRRRCPAGCLRQAICAARLRPGTISAFAPVRSTRLRFTLRLRDRPCRRLKRKDIGGPSLRLRSGQAAQDDIVFVFPNAAARVQSGSSCALCRFGRPFRQARFGTLTALQGPEPVEGLKALRLSASSSRAACRGIQHDSIFGARRALTPVAACGRLGA